MKEIFTVLQEIYTKAQNTYLDDDRRRLDLAMQYIQKNFYRKITLQSMSDYLALTPGYFCNWFKKTTGENFASTVTRYRIDAAKDMLAQSDKKIGDIAADVGYSEIVSFNRVFKKIVGKTPTQYRQEFQPEESEQP